MRNILRVCLIILAVAFFVPTEGHAATDWIEHPLKTNVPIDKTWEIKMNHEIDKTTIHNDSIFVLDENGNKLKTQVTYTSKKDVVQIEAPNNYYNTDTTYTLYVTDAVRDKNGKTLNATKMKFKTNNNLVVEDIFVENEKNYVEVKDNVSVIEKIGDAIPHYSNTSLTIVHPTEEMKEVKQGEIMILPPTKDFPFGYAVRVEKRTLSGNTLQLKVIEPTEEEIIQSLDIASSIPLSAIENIDKLNHQNNSVAALGPIALTTTTNIPIELIDNGFSIKFEDLELEDKLHLSGGIEFVGNVDVLERDDKKVINSDLQLKTELTVNMYYAKDKIGKGTSADTAFKNTIALTQVPITYRIPQTAFFLGLSLKPSFVYEIKGDIGSEITVNRTNELHIGFDAPKKSLPDLTYINMPEADSSVSIGAFDANASIKIGVEVPFALVIAQYELVTVGAEAGIETKLEGYIDGLFEFTDLKKPIPTISTGTNYCLKAGVEFYANPFAALGDIENPTYKFEFFKKRMPILSVQNCAIKNLTMNNLTVSAYENLYFPVMATDYQGKTQSFNLYDENVKLESIESNKIVKARKTKPITNLEIPGSNASYMLQNVEIGEKVKARISYTNTFTKAVTKQDIIVTVAGNVKGKIVDDKGKAIKGATVQLYNNKKLIDTFTTDTDGKYEMISKTTDYSLIVSHPSYKKTEVTGKLKTDISDVLTKDRTITLSSVEKISYAVEKLDKRYSYIKLKSSSINVNALNKELLQPAKDAKKFYDDMKGNVVFSTADSKITYSDNNYLSINIQTGNDYIAPDSYGFIIDLRTGKRLTVNDVFKTTAQRDKLVQKIKSELRRLGEPQKNPVYNESRLVYSSSWGIYATKSGYVIILGYYNDANIFDLYEITVPYSESTALSAL